MSTGDITIIVAIAGLLLSVYKFYLNQREKGGHTFKVEFALGFLESQTGFGESMLILKAVNGSKEGVYISSAPALAIYSTFMRKGYLTYPEIDGTKKLPFWLAPNEPATFWVSLDVVKASLRRRGFTGKVKVRACFCDAVGRNYYNPKKVTLNTENATG